MLFLVSLNKNQQDVGVFVAVAAVAVVASVAVSVSVSVRSSNGPIHGLSFFMLDNYFVDGCSGHAL